MLRAIPLSLAQKVAEYRGIAKKLRMLRDAAGSYIKHVEDGRIYGSISNMGALTGRCTHSDPNLAQVPKDDDLRDLFTASRGWVLISADLDAIEMRCLAHRISTKDGGALTRVLETGSSKLGTDFHSSNQRAVGLYSRNNAKRLCYADLYGAGYRKLGLIVAEDSIAAGHGFTGSYEAAGKRAKAKLRANIVGYEDLINDLQTIWQQNGTVTALDGRLLHPKGSHTILNTLLQGDAAIVMKVGLVIFDDEIACRDLPVRYLLNVHDEAVVETLPERVEEVKQTLCDAFVKAGTQLGMSCPVRANAKSAETWGKAK